jgi:hypothetical protein
MNIVQYGGGSSRPVQLGSFRMLGVELRSRCRRQHQHQHRRHLPIASCTSSSLAFVP